MNILIGGEGKENVCIRGEHLEIFGDVSFGRALLAISVHAKSLQLCPTLCDPMDCSPPDSSLHGILQGRILE